jgi:hypothetical protein
VCRATAESQYQFNVFSRGKGGKELKELKEESDLLKTKLRASSERESAYICSLNKDEAARWLKQSADQ